MMHSAMTDALRRQRSSWKLLVIAALVIFGGIGTYTLWRSQFLSVQTAQATEKYNP
jgi:hypothetical protein